MKRLGSDTARRRPDRLGHGDVPPLLVFTQDGETASVPFRTLQTARNGTEAVPDFFFFIRTIECHTDFPQFREDFMIEHAFEVRQHRDRRSVENAMIVDKPHLHVAVRLDDAVIERCRQHRQRMQRRRTEAAID